MPASYDTVESANRARRDAVEYAIAVRMEADRYRETLERIADSLTHPAKDLKRWARQELDELSDDTSP